MKKKNKESIQLFPQSFQQSTFFFNLFCGKSTFSLPLHNLSTKNKQNQRSVLSLCFQGKNHFYTNSPAPTTTPTISKY